MLSAIASPHIYLVRVPTLRSGTIGQSAQIYSVDEVLTYVYEIMASADPITIPISLCGCEHSRPTLCAHFKAGPRSNYTQHAAPSLPPQLSFRL